MKMRWLVNSTFHFLLCSQQKPCYLRKDIRYLHKGIFLFYVWTCLRISRHIFTNLWQWIRDEGVTYFHLDRPERKTQAHIHTVLRTCFCPQTVDAIALQMCLERLEPRVEDFQEASRRQEWCDSVLSLKVPLETIIRKESAEDKELRQSFSVKRPNDVNSFC